MRSAPFRTTPGTCPPCSNPSSPQAAQDLAHRQRVRRRRGRGLAGSSRPLALRAVQSADRAGVSLLLRPGRPESRQVRDSQSLRPVRGTTLHRLPDENLAGRRNAVLLQPGLRPRQHILSLCWRRRIAGSLRAWKQLPGFTQDQSQRLHREPGGIHSPGGPGNAAATELTLPGGAETADRFPRAADSHQHRRSRCRCPGLE